MHTMMTHRVGTDVAKVDIKTRIPVERSGVQILAAQFLATFLSVLSFEPVTRNFLIIFAIALFTGACLLNFSKKLCLQWA